MQQQVHQCFELNFPCPNIDLDCFPFSKSYNLCCPKKKFTFEAINDLLAIYWRNDRGRPIRCESLRESRTNDFSSQWNVEKQNISKCNDKNRINSKHK